MTLTAAVELALTVHGAVCVVGIAAYYKYGNRADLYGNALLGNRSLRQIVRDNIATELSTQLQPVIREATRARSPVLESDGRYFEHVADITKSEAFYQSIRDYVSRSSNSLIDYRLALETSDCLRTWARRLSLLLLVLVILEILVIGGTVLMLVMGNPNRADGEVWFLWSLFPMCAVVVLLLWSLCMVHLKRDVIVDLRERYDPEA